MSGLVGGGVNPEPAESQKTSSDWLKLWSGRRPAMLLVVAAPVYSLEGVGLLRVAGLPGQGPAASLCGLQAHVLAV